MARKFSEMTCISCGTLYRTKSLKKIHKKYYCKSCAKQLRKQRRKQTIEISGIDKELKQFRNKIAKERGYARKNYVKKHPNAKKYTLDAQKPLKTLSQVEPVTIKGAIQKQKVKTNSYLTLQERQVFFRILLKRGFDGEQAKQRISKLNRQLARTTKLIKDKCKSELEIKEQIKINKDKLLRGLYESQN